MISSVVRTVLVYVAVVVAMRLMGKRQLGELQPAERIYRSRPAWCRFS